MKIVSKYLCLLVASATCLTASSTPATLAKGEQPNVILIFADDLGPGMLGSYGQQIVKTPHIDRLAAEGMSFSNYYGGVYCAPARWTLLSGMHDGRLGGYANNRGGLPILRDSGEITEAEYQKRLAVHKAKSLPIPDHEVFLAQVAQQAGYTTAQFGKLDRGFSTWHERVKRFGWDFYEGYYDHTRCHGFYPPYLWRNGERFDIEGNDDPTCGKMSEQGNEPVGSGGEVYSQNIFIAGILKYIREHKDERFFLYHPTQLPHGPVAIPEIHPDFVNDDRLSLSEKKYASMVKMLDDHVGLIMAELKVLGLDEKTMVLFSSDNGHELYYSPKNDAKPKENYNKQTDDDGVPTDLTDNKWRTSEQGDIFNGAGGRAGLKRSGYQGGLQCPMIVRWPGKIEAGTWTDLLSTHYDFLATMADIGGVAKPKGKDGISYLPTLLGQPQVETHDYVIVNNLKTTMASSAMIDRDGWKIVEIGKKRDGLQLYNILQDNEERHELSAQYPERVETMGAVLKKELNSERPDL